MACSSCSKNGTPQGCGNKGHCASGACNKLNTFDWLTDIEAPANQEFDVVEVSFKDGARKAFFRRPPYVYLTTGDLVVVECSAGYDLGRITLSGELVRLQMRKKRVKSDAKLHQVMRIANERDLERLEEARELEKETMVRARAIARQLELDMKIGDVEYQADKRKATFYYTADGRVDFRELIRVYAREFRVKIEMRQIGARQESARIGGLGSCGRELCCSTWLSDFKSVSTTAARYQNLAINQSKLSGQCGRLKCCLNFELDTYMDALREFPKNVNRLETEVGVADLIKTDIFKRLLYFTYRDATMSKTYALSVERVREIQRMNKKGKKPLDLIDADKIMQELEEKREDQFIDGTGDIELKPLEKKKRRRRRSNKKRKAQPQKNRGRNGAQESTTEVKESKATQKRGKRPPQAQGNEEQGEEKQNKPRNSRPRRRGGRNRNRSNNTKRNQNPPNTNAKNTPKGPKPPKSSGDNSDKD